MRVEGSSEQEDGQVDNRLYGLQVCANNIHSYKVATQCLEVILTKNILGQTYKEKVRYAANR